jgi:hypothetical protein
MERRLGSVLAVFAVTASVVACGGGGGGGGSSAPVVPASTQTPTPATATPVATITPNGTFVASSGTVTTIGTASTLGTTIQPGSANAYLVAQVATTPSETSTNGVTTLTAYQGSVVQTAGLSTSSVLRSTDAATRARLAATAANHADPEARPWEVPQAAFLPVMRQVLANRRASGSETRAERALRQTQAAPAVGAQRQFVILGGTITGGTGSGNTTITATLEAQGAHGNVWVDNLIVNNPTTFAAEFPSGAADFQTTATFFDTVYATETATYGPAFTTANLATTSFQQCDANKNPLPTAQYLPAADTSGTSDPHVNIVITDVLQGTGEGGYYYGLNSFNQQVANCVGSVSNGVPMFVMGSDNYTPVSDPNPLNTFGQYNEYYWLNADMKRTVSHEFQHLLHFTNKYLQRVVNGQTGVIDDAWIDEGSSMLAEDLAGNGLQTDTPSFVYTYLLEPSDFSLTSFTGYNPNPLASTAPTPYVYNHNLAGDYGMSYLFLRYIYDRFGVGGIKSLYASTGSGPQPILDAAGGEPFAQLYQEWALATALHTGGSTALLTSDPRYKYAQAEVLRGNITVISRRICCQTRTLVMPGPLAPEIFQNNLPVGYVTASTGAAQSFQILDGGTAWLPGFIASGGATIRTTSTAPSYEAGIVQGPIPAPSPTRF